MATKVAHARRNGSKGGRPAKGQVEWRGDRWWGRFTLLDGSRPWEPLEDDADGRPPQLGPDDESAARALAARLSDRLRAPDAAAERDFGAHETCDAWFQRFCADRVRKGIGSVRDDGYRWKGWIAPRIGRKRMGAVRPDDIEDIRDDLDAAVRRHVAQGKGPGRLSGNTAMSVWSVLKTAFGEATHSKNRELRVLKGAPDPTEGIKPPEKTAPRAKTFVYPIEFATLAACEAVPLAWRELHAIATYLYLRPGELRALRRSDVDLDHGRVSITKAWDVHAKKVGPPKTRNGVREVPIPATLLPLLRRMLRGAPSNALVVPLLDDTNEDVVAGIMRDHLTAAGLTRTRLFEETRTTMRVNFRSWRDTGITWLALDGVDLHKIKARAGHDQLQTTLGYVKQAEDVGGELGQPFPPLPAALVEPPGGLGVGFGKGRRREANSPTKPLCEGRELNPQAARPEWSPGGSEPPAERGGRSLPETLGAHSDGPNPKRAEDVTAVRIEAARALLAIGDLAGARAILDLFGEASLGSAHDDKSPKRRNTATVIDLAIRAAGASGKGGRR